MSYAGAFGTASPAMHSPRLFDTPSGAVVFRRIEFIGSPRIAAGKGVVVDALADGLAVICHFPPEVLNDAVCITASGCPKELFESRKSTLLQAAERKLRIGQFKSGKALIGTSDVQITDTLDIEGARGGSLQTNGLAK